MQDLQQKRSKAQQSQKGKGLISILLGNAEFSKKMAVFDTIYYIVFAVASITLACIWQPFAAICPELLTIFTTGLVTLRLGYVAKAGAENFAKIKNTFDSARGLQEEINAEEEEAG